MSVNQSHLQLLDRWTTHPRELLFQSSAAEGGLGGLCNASFVAPHNSWGFPFILENGFHSQPWERTFCASWSDAYFLSSKQTCKWEEFLSTCIHFPFWRNVSSNLRKNMLIQIVKMQSWKYLVFASLISAHHPVNNPVDTPSYLLMDSVPTFPTLKNRLMIFMAAWQLVYLIPMSL